MLSIMTNAASINAQRNILKTQGGLNTSLARLSSGYRINNSADDAAGLAVSELMKGQIRSYSQAERNANDGISLLQVTEGAMSEVSDTLARMRELAIEAANGSFNDTQRGLLQLEVAQHLSEIDRIAGDTKFNDVSLIDGSTASVAFQVGTHNDANATISAALVSLTTTDFAGTDISGIDMGTAAGAQAALDTIDAAFASLTGARATLGSVQSRLQTTISNLRSINENLQAANSRIRDTDVAEETASLTRASIMMQAGVSVLAQANKVPTMTLSLLS